MARLRFAPSPTGYLHLGSLRTALFNYLYAKQQEGTFVFRLEDTDQQRLVEGSEANLIKMLNVANVEIQEGGEIGGPFGPYRQSERLPIYQKYAKQLLDGGHAYRCFCSPETLNQMKEEQREQGVAVRYDGRCRHLSEESVQEKMDAGQSFVIRMKIPENDKVILKDLIRGDVVIETEQLDDQVLTKTDGFPTYHLAMVVDDHLMEITHVVRGEEWLPSFPKHLLLFQQLNWEPPQFAHLPLILNADRSKLSKRQGDVAVEDYLKQGFLPEALVNFIALLGWSAGDDQEIFSMEELIEKFSFERVGKAGAVFDREKLRWMNQQYIMALELDDLFERLQPFIQSSEFAGVDREQLKKVCAIVQPRLVLLADIVDKLPLFFAEKPELSDPALIEVLKSESSQIALKAFKELLTNEDEIDANNFPKLMKAVQKQTGVKGKNLWHPMRYALTLEEQGPDLPLVAAVFGKEKCLQMVEQALELA